ncbi:hypothetical protein [Nonomuraea sp. NPDC049784]|uniref:hypothetical protein n=1 Tax=Nonomuraea sp. NPDC049784 TaxID=3154361 RepID=UPI0033E0D185
MRSPATTERVRPSHDVPRTLRRNGAHPDSGARRNATLTGRVSEAGCTSAVG